MDLELKESRDALTLDPIKIAEFRETEDVITIKRETMEQFSRNDGRLLQRGKLEAKYFDRADRWNIGDNKWARSGL